jgi:hypothetical protein
VRWTTTHWSHRQAVSSQYAGMSGARCNRAVEAPPGKPTTSAYFKEFDVVRHQRIHTVGQQSNFGRLSYSLSLVVRRVMVSSAVAGSSQFPQSRRSVGRLTRRGSSCRLQTLVRGFCLVLLPPLPSVAEHYWRESADMQSAVPFAQY